MHIRALWFSSTSGSNTFFTVYLSPYPQPSQGCTLRPVAAKSRTPPTEPVCKRAVALGACPAVGTGRQAPGFPPGCLLHARRLDVRVGSASVLRARTGQQIFYRPKLIEQVVPRILLNVSPNSSALKSRLCLLHSSWVQNINASDVNVAFVRRSFQSGVRARGSPGRPPSAAPLPFRKSIPAPSVSTLSRRQLSRAESSTEGQFSWKTLTFPVDWNKMQPKRKGLIYEAMPCGAGPL